MSETREQFRERIGLRHFDTFHIAENNGRSHASSWLDAAEAVYAQALRDVIALSFMTYIPGTDDLAPIVAVSQIKRFAADRGIDLRES